MIRSLRFLLFLAWEDFVSSYRGSFLGWIWGLIEPVFYITLTFFFFQYVIGGGARVGGQAYATYVLPVMLGWLVTATGIQAAVGVVPQYQQFLHEDFDFRSIAIIKLLPTFTIHILTISVLATFFYFSGIAENFSALYLIYSIVCLMTVLVGVFWLLMSISPFVKDVKNIVGILLQIGFWVVPIFWEASKFPGAVSWIVQLEPFYYPLATYRVAFTGAGGELFSVWTAVFWLTCGLLLYWGNRTYRRARPHFGDVV